MLLLRLRLKNLVTLRILKTVKSFLKIFENSKVIKTQAYFEIFEIFKIFEIFEILEIFKIF